MARISYDTILSETNLTAGTYYSEIVPLENLYGYSVEADWVVTGSCNAVIFLLATNITNKADDKWLPISESAEIITNTNGKLTNVNFPAYKYFRVKVIVNSGTLDQIDVNYFAKG